MQLYTNADLISSNIPIKSYTVSAGTKGFMVTNFSDVPFSVTSSSHGNLATIQPYFAQTFVCMPGDTITLSPSIITTNALKLPSMYVDIVDQFGTVNPGTVALSQPAGYTQTFQLADGASISINNIPTVNLASGTNITANIQNVADVQIMNSVVNTQMITNAMNTFSYGPAPTGGATYNLIPAGGHIYTLSLTYWSSWTYGSPITLYNGGNAFWTDFGSGYNNTNGIIYQTYQHQNFTFGNGVPNNGITAFCAEQGHVQGAGITG